MIKYISDMNKKEKKPEEELPPDDLRATTQQLIGGISDYYKYNKNKGNDRKDKKLHIQ
jgi:hypothetical protein